MMILIKKSDGEMVEGMGTMEGYRKCTEERYKNTAS